MNKLSGPAFSEQGTRSPCAVARPRFHAEKAWLPAPELPSPGWGRRAGRVLSEPAIRLRAPAPGLRTDRPRCGGARSGGGGGSGSGGGTLGPRDPGAGGGRRGEAPGNEDS